MWLAGLILACAGHEGGSDTGGVPAADDATFPMDTSLEGITAFLASETYTEGTWVAETAGPRERNNDVSPHGRVRVFGNRILIASQLAGNGAFEGSAHDTHAMAVKELYDGETRIGRAAMLKIEGPASEWIYFCDGPADRCGVSMSTPPVWGIALDTECGFCHGGLVFNGF